MLYLYAFISAVFTFVTALTNLNEGTKLIWLLPIAFLGTYIALIILQLLFFVIVTLLVNVKKPIEKCSKFYRFLVRILLRVLIPLLRVKIHATGLEKIPTNCRFMLVSNHLHDFDPAVFFDCLPNSDLAFIGKKDIYVTMKFIAKAMHKLNGLPIDRENNRNAILTINAAAEIIKKDTASVAIFPEGYCSLSGELLPFRNGAFKIAKKAKCPIVVATLKNTKQIVKNMPLKKTDVYLDILEVVSAKKVEELSTAELGDKIHKIMSDNLN